MSLQGPRGGAFSYERGCPVPSPRQVEKVEFQSSVGLNVYQIFLFRGTPVEHLYGGEDELVLLREDEPPRTTPGLAA